MESIKQVLMKRDNMSSKAANELIRLAREEFESRMESGEDASDICEEYFGLEPDYIYDLI